MTELDYSLAVCAQVAPDLFFPKDLSEAMSKSSFQTRELCFTCPLIEECFEIAMRTPGENDWGIWGGTFQNERAKMRRKTHKHLLDRHRARIKEAMKHVHQAEGEAA